MQMEESLGTLTLILIPSKLKEMIQGKGKNRC